MGNRIAACYSQNKNELIIEFEMEALRIGCNTPLTYVIPTESFSKAKKNVVELFTEIQGLAITHSFVVDYDRVWLIELEKGYQLILKMHGTTSNVILRKVGKVVALFNQNLEADWEFVPNSGPFHPEHLQTAPPTTWQEVLTMVKAVSFIYEKQFAKRIWKKMEAGLAVKEAFQEVITDAKSGLFYICKTERRIQFLLFPPNDDIPFAEVAGVIPALDLFLKCHFQYQHYQNQYKTVQREIDKPYKKYQKVFKSYQENIHQIQQLRSSEELGHIIMANLHRIPKDSKSVDLEDFYQSGTVTIPLDPRKTPQANASKYYDKHKQRKSKLAYLESQVTDIESKYKRAERKLNQFLEILPPDQLSFGQDGFDWEELKLIRSIAKSEEKNQSKAKGKISPFRTFRMDGYEIFVGKNAKNSDELSFKFANKEDLWLHVKDVPGSHVIIRQKAGQTIPPHVLEYAAQLAAFYSKRKTDSLVPVQYTTRKYIRKRKGDPPGLVAVDRESVIMVVPTKP